MLMVYQLLMEAIHVNISGLMLLEILKITQTFIDHLFVPVIMVQQLQYHLMLVMITTVNQEQQPQIPRIIDFILMT
uniref:Uncharacterized protein n=1 Tax=Amphimedon queenslandica TaxID=400682 RepID=A0A1X7T4J2_AMPQE